jgi:hypothetical protein
MLARRSARAFHEYQLAAASIPFRRKQELCLDQAGSPMGLNRESKSGYDPIRVDNCKSAI